jgi:hypothetical protein
MQWLSLLLPSHDVRWSAAAAATKLTKGKYNSRKL